MRLMVSLALLALIAPAATAQQPTAGTTTLTLQGVVVTSNDVPLPRVRVALAPAVLSPELVRLGAWESPFEQPGVLTDERGRFTIRVPVKASVRLAFAKARYVSFTADASPRDLTVPGSEIRAHMSLAGAISTRAATWRILGGRNRATDRTVERGIVSPDRDLLDSLSSRAVRITLAEGESQNVPLNAVRR